MKPYQAALANQQLAHTSFMKFGQTDNSRLDWSGASRLSGARALGVRRLKSPMSEFRVWDSGFEVGGFGLQSFCWGGVFDLGL